MDDLAAIPKLYENYLVFFIATMLVAGPMLGIFAVRFRQEMKDREPFLTLAAVLLLPILPALEVGPLITHPGLALVDHPKQAWLGVLCGLLILVGGGIAIAGDNWSRRRRERPD